jgi:hypothetical protein
MSPATAGATWSPRSRAHELDRWPPGVQESRLVGPGELLDGNPKTWPGANKLLATMKVTASMLGQEIHEKIQQMPAPQSNIQTDIDSKQRQLGRLDKRMEALGDQSGFGEVFGPAWEDQALRRLFEVGARKETELAKDVGDDPWDVAAWCDQAEASGLIEKMASASAPKRHWKITDSGREAIGYPSAR